MRYAVLGSIRVFDADVEVRLHGRLRLLLAVLLCRAGEVASVDELVDAVWGPKPPRTARKNLQVYVHQLRQALGGGASLSFRGSGYALIVDTDEVDAWRFEDFVARGRRSIAAGDVEKGRAYLGDALALWRGPAYADVTPVPIVRSEAARLEERRLVALEECGEVDLAAGRYANVIAELSALLVTYPWREAMVAQLMLALYRSGRQAEALRVFRDTRRTLVDELGIEPGLRLQQLQQAILANDPALDVDAYTAREPTDSAPVEPTGSEPVRPPPAQLPSDIHRFVGRAAELRMLRALLPEADSSERSSAVVVAIDGTAGVGKTSLALRWAWEVAHRYTDGQLYLNLRGHSIDAPMQPADALAQLLRALGLAPQQVPQDLAEAAALYRSMIAGGRYLLLLDNVASADHVRPLLPGGAGCLAVITSRRRLGGLAVRDGAHTISLDVLTREESISLLRRLIGDDRIQAEPDATEQLAALCADLPLALCIAAARIREQPTTTLAGYLAELRGDRLAALAVPGDDETAMRSAFTLSYRAMNVDTARLFRLLGLVPGADFQPEAAAAVAGLPLRATRRLLRELSAAHVLEHLNDDRFTMHDLLRDYSRELALTEHTRKDATRRLYAWYVETARAAAAQSYPHMLRLPPTDSPVTGMEFQDAKTATAWLDAEYPNLVEAIRQGVDGGQPTATWRLADALRGYLPRRSHLAEWLAIADTALSSARAAGDKRAQAAAHLSLSLAYRSRCDYPRTIEHLHLAHELTAACGWTEGELTTLGNLAGAYYDIGALAEVHDLFTRVLELSRRLEHPGNTAVALSNLGATLRDLGRPAEALDRLAEAVEGFRTMNSPVGEADALDNIGTTYHQMGKCTEALTALGAALTIHRELGDSRSEASVLTNLAAALCDTNRIDEALSHVRRAMELAADSGSPRTEAEALNVASRIAVARGEPHQALRLAERAHQLAVEVGVRQPQIAALIGQAAAHQALGSTELGSALARQAFQTATSHGFAFLAERSAHLLSPIP